MGRINTDRIWRKVFFKIGKQVVWDHTVLISFSLLV